MSFLEHSRKIGRISALIIVLSVAAIISIMAVSKDATKIDTVLDDWLKLAGIAMTFYFLTAPKRP